MKLRNSILAGVIMVSLLLGSPITTASYQKDMKTKNTTMNKTEMQETIKDRIDGLTTRQIERALDRLPSLIARFQANQEIYQALVMIETLLQQEQATLSVAGIATSSDDFSILVQAVSELGLVETLDSQGPFTVFAPTNKAFENLLGELNITAEELLGNETMLQSIVMYHVVEGTVTAEEVTAMTHGTLVTTLQGEKVMVNNMGGVSVDQSNVTQADIFATNGVVHVIDEVLLPPTVRTMLGLSVDRGQNDIVDTAINAGSFPTLMAAVQAAGLENVLRMDGPYTVFAPTEEAFTQLLYELDVSAEELLNNKELLTSVLTYHVVPGRYNANDVVSLEGPTQSPTANGTMLTIDPHQGAPMVNDANIVQTDIYATNGVIHVIDKVLLP